MTPSVSRRRFLLASAGLALATPSLAQRRDYVDLRDLVGGRAGPHTSIVAQAFAEARRTGERVVAKAGTYLLDDDLPIDWNGFVLEGEGERTRFVQTRHGRGFLQLRGDNCRVAGFRLVCDFERRRVSGVWRGYNEFQRVSAVWVEGNRSVLEGVSGENTFGVVCLRGPVVPLQGAERTGDARNYDYTRRAVGNRVTDIAGHATDFVLTGNQQEDLVIDGLTARDTTSNSVPPHAIYMQNPGSTAAFCGYSLRVTAKRLDSVGNTHSDAFKFSDIRDLTVESAVARDTVGGMMISTSDGVVVRGLDWTYRGSGAARTAVRITQSTRVRIAGGRSAGRGGAVLAYNGSEAVDVEGFDATDEFMSRGSNAPYRVLDTSDARFVKCRRERRGADGPMFVVANKAVATIEDPECRHSAQVVLCGPEATVNLRVDPTLVDGWTPAKSSISGARDRIRTLAPGDEPRRLISRPLPGTRDNACP